MGAELSYAYAVVRPPLTLPRDLLGVAGGLVRLVEAERVAAAVGSVPESEFSEAALTARLEDLDWLEAVARAHHGVVEALAAHTTVLPLRLATVYLDDDRVRDALRRDEASFTDLLDRLAGSVEWGVKVYAEQPAPGGSAGAEAGGGAGPEGGPPDPGRAYLRRRRQQHVAREASWASAADAVRRIEAEARAVALRHARHRPQQQGLAGARPEEGAPEARAPGENVANDAYLVPRERSAEFRERVLRSVEGAPGVRVEITGPWAPYSFAAAPERTDAPEGGPAR
ncbi:GvpL/GvpF family gas vesicle protein [Streptomyces fradiae]|uniref:GvpL/GvpF family gas vesicle protein n=1 Tax=Streptomyces fradiae TaxID=1906 RepID=UPI003700A5C2